MGSIFKFKVNLILTDGAIILISVNTMLKATLLKLCDCLPPPHLVYLHFLLRCVSQNPNLDLETERWGKAATGTQLHTTPLQTGRDRVYNLEAKACFSSKFRVSYFRF